MNLLYSLIYFLFFPIILLISFYIPGRVILGKNTTISPFARTILSLIIGIAAWGVQGFIFGYLGIRSATYIYLLFFWGAYIYKHFDTFQWPKHFPVRKLDIISAFIIVIGVIAQNINYFFIGMHTSDGILLTSFNRIDHIWHSSLILEIVKQFPPNEPGMYGVPLTNYHIWFDLVTAELVRVFHLPLLPTQFVGMYPFGCVMIGLSAYIVTRRIFPSRIFSNVVLFLLYFGGDISYLFTFWTTKSFQFNAPSLIDRSLLFMDNPPRAFSHIVVCGVLYFLSRFVRKEHTQREIGILVLLFSVLIGFKVYTGIVVLIALFCLSLYHFLQRRFSTFFIFIVSFLISLVIFLPMNGKSSGGIMFLPFDRARDFLTYKPLGFFDWELRWQIYVDHHNFLRIVQYGLMMTGIYYIIQFGTRVLGLVPYSKTIKILHWDLTIFLYTGVFAGLGIGTFFAQRANISEVYNFYIPSIFLLIFLTGLLIALFLHKKQKFVQYLILSMLIIFTIPRWVYEVSYSLYNQTHSMITVSNQELSSYEFLKNSIPENSLIAIVNLNTFDSISAVAKVFSDRNMFLSGQYVTKAHGITNSQRINVLQTVALNNNPHTVSFILHKNNIQYLYVYASDGLHVSPDEAGLKKVFDNGFAQIYKVL